MGDSMKDFAIILLKELVMVFFELPAQGNLNVELLWAS